MKSPYVSTATVPAPAGHSLLTAIFKCDGTLYHVLREPIKAYVEQLALLGDDSVCVVAQPVLRGGKRFAGGGVWDKEAQAFVGGDWWDSDERLPRAIECGTNGTVLVSRDGCATYDNADAWLAALKPRPKQKRGRK